MWNKVPALFLLVVALAVAVFYFQVIQPFVLPLIFACVLAVLFWPVYRRMIRLCLGRRRIAAALTTCLIMLVILLPLGGGLILAALQLVDAVQQVSKTVDIDDLAGELEEGTPATGGEDQSALERRVRELRSRFTKKQLDRLRQTASTSITRAAEAVYDRTVNLVANVVSFVIGTLIMLLGLYYFFADNEQILSEVERLSPLEASDDRQIKEGFVQVCRGIFYGNILAALFQAVANGLGFMFLGLETAWLLAFITFFLSFVPFVGAGAVWIFVVIGLVFQQRYLEAVLLTAYGTLVVSSIDNLVRAYALRGSARIHPLIALISILGGIQLVGLWGIVVGPVAAAFMYALLNILNQKVEAARRRRGTDSADLILPEAVDRETAEPEEEDAE